MSSRVARLVLAAAAMVALVGCRSPYYADQGALLGGLGGAGIGALVGNATGHTGAGALIGAGAGAIGGGLVGGALDDIEARNQAQIAQQMAAYNMQAPVGAVTANDVVQMTRAGVAPDLIVNHIRANGVASPLQSGDVIYLTQQGVAREVISAMQSPPVRTVATPVAVAPATIVPGPVVVEHVAPAPIIVEEHFYGPPRYFHHHHHHRPHGVSWGVSVSH